jgi:amino acid adenylation domain-containing protein
VCAESTTRITERLRVDCVHRVVAGWAEGHSSAAGLLGGDGGVLDYGGLSRQITEVVAALRSWGISPDDCVAMVLPAGVHGAAALLSVSAGAICAPLNPACTSADSDLHLSILHPRALVVPCGSESPALESARARGIPIIELVPAAGNAGFVLESALSRKPLPFSTARSADTALLLQTSGTATAPKVVPLTHRMLAASAANIGGVLDLSAADRLLQVMPLHHIHGISTVCAALCAGGSVGCAYRFDPDKFPGWLAAFEPTWYTAAPAIHSAVVNHFRDSRAGSPNSILRFVRSASAPIPLKLAADLEALFGVPLIESYGMTEATAQITSNRLPPHPRKAGSAGQPAGPEVAVMDGSGRPLPPGKTGEIVIRGETVVKGYVGRDRDETQFFPPDWFRTGDGGYLDEDGFLFVTERLKEMINRGGEKISPLKVEQVLMQHPTVAGAACFPVVHPTLGEEVAAAVVVDGGDADRVATGTGRVVFERELRSFAAARLAHHEAPRRIMVVDEIPADPSGKVNRRRLAEKTLPVPAGDSALENSDVARPGDAPSPAEKTLLEIIGGVLKTGAIGIHDDFFLAGGDSLSAMQVVARIGRAFPVALTVEDLFEHATVARLAGLLGRRMLDRAVGTRAATEDGAVHRKILRRAGTGPFPVSFVQQRMWILDQLGGGSAYNVSATLHLAGELDAAVLAESIGELCRRHDILRAVFRMQAGRVVQGLAPVGPVQLPQVDLSTSTGARMARALDVARRELDQPFDLASGPLYRVTLLRLAPDEHLLVFIMHHIICDGWSRNVLHRELAAAYAAIGERRPPLPAPPIQYADYAAWERERVESGALDGQLDYWRDRLRDTPPVSGFPTDRPRPAVQSHRGASHLHGIDWTLLTGLETLGRHRDATLFMVLLAAFKVLLFRYTFQADCLVGTPVAGRTVEETEGLIGCFANTLVLRSDLSGNPTFEALLDRVRTTTREAYANQDFPFDKVVEALHPDRDLSRMPLFQVMLAFQDMPDGGMGASFNFAEDLRARPVSLEGSRAKFDLTVYLSRSERGLETTWQYNPDLFDAGTVARIGRHYETTLAGIVDDPGRRISDYPLAGDEQSTSAGDDDLEAAPADGSFTALFEATVREVPDALAVAAPDGEELTYRALNRRAERMAVRLRCLGAGAGSVVALLLPRSVAFVSSLLAVWKAGGAGLLCDPSYPAGRIAFMLADAGAAFVIADPGLLTELELDAAVRGTGRDPGDPALVVVDPDTGEESILSADGDAPVAASAGDPAYIVYTSGSSGEPKGVVIDHGNLVHYARAMRDALEITAGDRCLHTASFGFSASVRQFVVPLGCGAAVVVAGEPAIRDPLALFDLIRRRRVSVVDFVPSYLQACVQSLESLDPQTRRRLLDNDLRLALSASEPLASTLARAWIGMTEDRVRLLNMYGQTETTGIVATYPVEGGPCPGCMVPVGRPIAGSRFYVLDALQRPVPPGVCGEVYVGGRGVGRGYVNRPHLTAECFLEDTLRPASGGRLYRTGDIGRWLPGGLLELVGRADEQIKVRGYRIEPREIEAVLRRHPSVSDATVLLQQRKADHGDTAPVSGDRLVACVTMSDEATVSAETPLNLRGFLGRNLPAYMVPAVVVILDAMPRLASGKLDRRSLAGLVADGAARGSHDEALRTPTERSLAGIWGRVLRVASVGRQDNFFDLGGDSLLSVQVVRAASEAGLRLGLGDLFQNQTLEALARAADEAAAVPEPGLATSSRSGDDPARTVWVAVEALRAWGREALEAAGLEARGAGIVTEVQLEASLRGQSTHNMIGIPRYARRIASGLMNANPDIRVERDTPLSAAIDGDNGPGQWVSVVAVEMAIRKAQEHGIGVASARRSNHFGAAGHYAWLAARRGLIGICTTNGPVVLAPTGGVTATFGNNPLAVGIPAGERAPVLLDATMSVAPRGKISLALSEGRPLEPGWILDRLGRPSTDLSDLAAGLGVPIGGHKGYGLALVMETLAGVLSGSGFCLDHRRELLRQNAGPPDTGHFFLVIDPALLMPADIFAERVDRMIEQVKSGEQAAGTAEILLPGEAELRARARHLERGMAPLRFSAYEALVRYGRKAGLETPLVPAPIRINVD